HFKSSQRELQRLLNDAPATPKGWIEITNRYRGKGWFNNMSAWQVPSEFLQMQEAVMAEKPGVILEIGTAKGATLLGWCRMASKKVISVDLPGGIHGGGYPAIKQRLYREFVSDRPGIELHLIQADSHIKETRNLAEKALAGDKVDVLFIDGDHSYDGVKTDFTLWSPLVRSGGMVIFHDILPHKHVADCEVDLLWNELKMHYENREFVHDSEQGWAGIGIIRMK
ncbi:MAG: hypothetical protein RL693_814, partial [Verrucomicrobiota bacterium]